MSIYSILLLVKNSAAVVTIIITLLPLKKKKKKISYSLEPVDIIYISKMTLKVGLKFLIRENDSEFSRWAQ